MTDHEITSIVLPRNAVVITPSMIPEYIYEYVNGRDVFSVLVVDEKVGPVQLALAPEMAHHVSAHLAAMVGQRGVLRAEWDQREGDR